MARRLSRAISGRRAKGMHHQAAAKTRRAFIQRREDGCDATADSRGKAGSGGAGCAIGRARDWRRRGTSRRFLPGCHRLIFRRRRG